MPGDLITSSRRVLEPIERISEVTVGLFMALGFTNSLSLTQGGDADVRTMLIGALGCNLTWGVIDGLLQLMDSMAEKCRGLTTLRAVRETEDREVAHRLIAEALPPAVTSVLRPEDLETIRLRLRELPEPPRRASLRWQDWHRALAVFASVVVISFPVALPFVLMREVEPAMIVSNSIAILMLFGLGYAYGRCSLRNPWIKGIVMVVVGATLVAVTRMLGA